MRKKQIHRKNLLSSIGILDVVRSSFVNPSNQQSNRMIDRNLLNGLYNVQRKLIYEVDLFVTHMLFFELHEHEYVLRVRT